MKLCVFLLLWKISMHCMSQHSLLLSSHQSYNLFTRDSPNGNKDVLGVEPTFITFVSGNYASSAKITCPFRFLLSKKTATLSVPKHAHHMNRQV